MTVSKTEGSGSKPDRGAKFVDDKIDRNVYYEGHFTINSLHLNPPWEIDDIIFPLIEDQLFSELGYA